MRRSLALVLGFVASCTAAPPDVGGGPPDGSGTGSGTGSGSGSGPEEPPAEVPILLAPLPQSTYWNSIPIHGSGPPSGTVLVQTMSQGALTVPIGASGNFCVDVPLVAGAMNMFQLRSVDAVGTLGTPVDAMVMQQGSPPPPPEGTPAKNVSLGGTVSTSEDVDGDLYDTIDDDWASEVTLNNAWFNEDWVWVLLSERSRIVKVIVVSDDDCPMQKYNVMFSDLDAPGDPTSDNANWTYTEIDVPWSATEIDYDPFITKHLAVRFVSGDCSSWGRGRHHLAELQAWTEPDAAPPPAEAPSCASGGVM